MGKDALLLLLLRLAEDLIADGGEPGDQEGKELELLSHQHRHHQKNIQDWAGKSLKCLRDHKDFFSSHNLSGIPQCFLVTMGVIDGRRESIEKDPAIPFRIQEIIRSIMKEAKHIHVASSTLVPEHHLAAVLVQEGSLSPGGHLGEDHPGAADEEL